MLLFLPLLVVLLVPRAAHAHVVTMVIEEDGKAAFAEATPPAKAALAPSAPPPKAERVTLLIGEGSDETITCVDMEFTQETAPQKLSDVSVWLNSEGPCIVAIRQAPLFWNVPSAVLHLSVCIPPSNVCASDSSQFNRRGEQGTDRRADEAGSGVDGRLQGERSCAMCVPSVWSHWPLVARLGNRGRTGNQANPS